MDFFEAVVFVMYWFAIYGVIVGFSWALDKLLRRVFGKGILPEGYFK